MNRIYFLFLTGMVVSQICFASATQISQDAANQQQMTEAYQKGLKTAEEGIRNEKLWAKGQGNPEMAQAYQEGLRAAEQGIRNQQLWAKGQGDPEMARAYQQGLEAAKEGQKNQQIWKRGYANHN